VPNFTEPVSTPFIAITVVVIFVIIGLAIVAVKKFKKEA